MLTDTAIKPATACEHDHKMADSVGLFLLVTDCHPPQRVKGRDEFIVSVYIGNLTHLLSNAVRIRWIWN